MVSSMRSVLVIDDDDFDATLLEEALSRFCDSVYRASDGSAGLRHLSAVDTDLVLLDLSMPGDSGLEVLDKIRKHSRCPCIPVVICSTSASERDIRSSYRASANAYVTKPDTLEGYEELANSIYEFWFQQAQLP